MQRVEMEAIDLAGELELIRSELLKGCPRRMSARIEAVVKIESKVFEVLGRVRIHRDPAEAVQRAGEVLLLARDMIKKLLVGYVQILCCTEASKADGYAKRSSIAVAERKARPARTEAHAHT